VLEIELPPHISDPKAKTAAGEFSRLRAELVAAEKVVADLEGRRPGAVAADRHDLAVALRAGKAEPPATALDALDAEIAADQRRAQGLALAVGDAAKELAAVVEARRGPWGAELDRQVEKDWAAVGAAVEQLAAARDKLATSLAVAGWLARFPHKPTVIPVGRTSVVAGLTGQNEAPVPWEAVLSALRAFARPPEPVEPAMAAATGT
jgi:hypothetical protein